MAEKGIVYVFVNPCLEGWVKIGMSDKDDYQDRLNELNRPSNIPLSFRAYAIYRVENPKLVEENIHGLIDCIDSKLRAREKVDSSGRTREREFFQISPEKALDIIKYVAKLRGDQEGIEIITPSEKEQEEESIVQQRRPKLSLKEINIPDDAELVFIYDESIVCTANVKENKLTYEGRTYSISGLALKLLQEKQGWTGKAVAGGIYFKYKGDTLADLRKQLELVSPVDE